MKKTVNAAEERKKLKSRVEELEAALKMSTGLEEKLRESGERFRAVFECSAIGMALVDKNGRPVVTNKSLQKMLGYSGHELAAMVFTEFTHSEDAPKNMELYKELLAGKRDHYQMEKRYVRKDGELVWANLTVSSIPDEQGRPSFILAMAEDITERKRFEEQLYFIVKGTASSVSEGFLHKLTECLAGALKVHFAFVAEPADKDLSEARVLSIWEGDRLSENFEYELKGTPCEKVYAGNFSFYPREVHLHFPEDEWLRQNGVESYMAVPLIDAAGRPLGHLGVMDTRPMEDATTKEHILRVFAARVASELERKRAEDALRKGEEKYRLVVETLQEGFWVIDKDACTTFVNASMSEMLGYTVEEMTGKHIFYFMDERGIEIATKNLARRKAGIREVHEFELIRKDGERVYTLMVASPLFDDKGGYAGAVAGVQDITERKRAEEELKEYREHLERLVEERTAELSQEIDERKRAEKKIAEEGKKYRGLVENLRKEYFFYIHGTDGVFTFVSPSITTVLGYSPEEMFCHFSQFITDNPLNEKVLHHTRLSLQGREQPSYEIEVYHKDGSIRWLEVHEIPLFDKVGKITGVEGIAHDITGRKKAEEELRASEEKIQAILDNSTAAIYIKDLDGRHILINRGFEAKIQVSKEEIIGKTDHELFPKDIADAFHANDLEIIKQGVPIEFEEALYLKDGAHTFISSKFPLFDSTGKLYAVCGMSTDITVRKRAEEALRESEEKYRTLFEESRDAVFITTLEGKVLDCNPAGIEMLGLSSREELLQAESIAQFYYEPSHREEFKRQIVERGFVKDFEVVMRKKDGRKVFGLITADAVRDEEGNIVAYRGVMHDMTEHRQLQEQLLQAQKMEAIGELTGGIAHDFNNIMTVIKTFSNLALKAPEEEGLGEYLENIVAASDRAANLTRQLLILSKRLPIELVTLNVNAVIYDLLKILGSVIGEHIAIKTNLSGDILNIKADKGSIEQLVMNLMVNARDAMAGGGEIIIRTSNVHVTEEECGNLSPEARLGEFVCLAVSDTGKGMDKEVMERVFEPFYSTKKIGQGTGLGLTVVSNIIKEHKGFVRVSSRPGKGSEFSIYIPAVTEAVKEKPERISAENHEGGGERVLLVEDEKMLLMSVALVLKMNKYNVFKAESAEEAIKVFDREGGGIDLVISDTVLPDESGIQLVEKLKAKNPGLRVILTSGYMDIESQWPEIQQMGYLFLQKPYDPQDLLKNIKEAMGNGVDGKIPS